MNDILFHKNDYSFSYRVAGILVHNGKILLQKPTNVEGFTIPGGHVTLGETSEETLKREFMEETGAIINVGELKWTGEIFESWDGKPCQRICLFYEVTLAQENDRSPEEIFTCEDEIEEMKYDLEFYWMPLAEIEAANLYPAKLKELLAGKNKDCRHFVHKE